MQVGGITSYLTYVAIVLALICFSDKSNNGLRIGFTAAQQQPSSKPSHQPSRQPSSQPSRIPTSQPSRQPSRQPTSKPSRQPTNQPTAKPFDQAAVIRAKQSKLPQSNSPNDGKRQTHNNVLETRLPEKSLVPTPALR